MIYVIASELPSDAVGIEHLVDRLFGETPNGLIARIMCQHQDPYGSETLIAIEDAMKKRYPREWKVMRYSLGSLLSRIQSAISDFQAEEKHHAST